LSKQQADVTRSLIVITIWTWGRRRRSAATECL
jgi:hypothetical protein